jgi:hypothetical protein
VIVNADCGHILVVEPFTCFGDGGLVVKRIVGGRRAQQRVGADLEAERR